MSALTDAIREYQIQRQRYHDGVADDDGFGECECEPPDADDAGPYICEACYLRTAYTRENSDA